MQTLKKTDSSLIEEIRRNILRLGNTKRGWYQPIDFGCSCRTFSRKHDDNIFFESDGLGLNKWNKIISPHLPFPVAGCRILEIGCNAAVFLVEMVRKGAEHVFGIENDPGFLEQARFVIDTFSKLEDVDYGSRITLLQTDAADFNYSSLGFVDLTVAANSLYWVTYPLFPPPGDPRAEAMLATLFNRVADISGHILVLGDVGASELRKGSHENNLCTDNKSTEPLLSDHFEVLQDVHNPTEFRSHCLLVARSKHLNFDIRRLEALLQDRPDNGLKQRFFKSFREFLTVQPDSESELRQSRYYSWISEMCALNGLYRGHDHNHISDICRADLDLFKDIQSKGLQKPIRLFREPPYGLNADGHHRMVIMDFLGYNFIPCERIDPPGSEPGRRP